MFPASAICFRGGVAAESIHLFAGQRDLRLPKAELRLAAKRLESEDNNERRFLVTVKTDKYARIVQLKSEKYEMEVERNFFDLPPQEEIETSVTIRHPQDDPVVITAKAWNSTEARMSLGA